MLLGLGELATMVFFLRINEQVPYTPAARTDGRWIREALTVAPSLAGDVCYGLRQDGAAMSGLEPDRANPRRFNVTVDVGLTGS